MKSSRPKPLARNSPVIRTYNRGAKRVARVRQPYPVDLEGLAPDKDHAWRHDNIGRLFLFAFHAFEERLMRRIHANGHPEIKHIHFHLFRTIDVTGTRIVDLARRLGVTKAAAGQLVREGEALDLFHVEAHETDRRAKIVTFTRKGRQMHRLVRNCILDLESEFKQLIGPRPYQSLRRELLRLRSRLADPDGPG
jgi:DNA-binding MarR family transcriptional regulator